MKMRVLIDNNCIDTMSAHAYMYRHFASQYEFCVSSMVVEELASIPDEKKEQRIQTFIAFAQAEVKFVLDAVFIIGYGRLGCCRLASKETIAVYNEILNESRGNVKDAIIATTAVYEDCTLLTNDKRLYEKMKAHDYGVMSFEELRAQFDASRAVPQA